MKARTKEEFVKIVREQVAAMRAMTPEQTAQARIISAIESRNSGDSVDRLRWIAPLATNGRAAVLHVTLNNLRYRFHANNDFMAMEGFLRDAEKHGITVFSFTKSTGDRVDTDNNQKARVGLYVYRKPA